MAYTRKATPCHGAPHFFNSCSYPIEIPLPPPNVQAQCFPHPACDFLLLYLSHNPLTIEKLNDFAGGLLMKYAADYADTHASFLLYFQHSVAMFTNGRHIGPYSMLDYLAHIQQFSSRFALEFCTFNQLLFLICLYSILFKWLSMWVDNHGPSRAISS